MVTTSHDDDERNGLLDARVRNALEPAPDVVSRVVAAARRPDTRAGRRFDMRRMAFPAAVLLLVGVALVLSMWPRTQPSVAVSRGVLTNDGHIMVLEMAGRPITLIAPEAFAAPVPAGTMSITLLGEAQ